MKVTDTEPYYIRAVPATKAFIQTKTPLYTQANKPRLLKDQNILCYLLPHDINNIEKAYDSLAETLWKVDYRISPNLHNQPHSRSSSYVKRKTLSDKFKKSKQSSFIQVKNFEGWFMLRWNSRTRILLGGSCNIFGHE